MSVAPGFSISELIQAIDKCRDIWDAFTDEYANAPARIKELVDTVGYLHTVLKYLDEIHGDVYPHKNIFLRKLQECERFIEKYKALRPRSVRSNSETSLSDKFRHPWDTAWYAIDGKRQAKALNEALSLQIQNLVVFFVVLGLKPNAPPISHDFSSHPTSKQNEKRRANTHASLTSLPEYSEYENSSGRGGPAVTRSPVHSSETSLGAFLEKLRLLQYRYERLTNVAAQMDREPNLTQLYDDFEDIWDTMCTSVGLTEDKRPALPDKDRLLTNSSLVMNDILINFDRSIPAAHPRPSVAMSPELVEEVWLPPGRSPTNPFSEATTHSTARTTPQSVRSRPTEVAPSVRSLILPEPAVSVEEHVASTELKGSDGNILEVRLGSWECHVAGQNKIVVWTGMDPKGRLEHTIPPDVYPVSLHSSYAKPLHMRFLKDKKHTVIWIAEDDFPHPQLTNPEYVFTSRRRHEEFQGVVRDKKLIKTYHIQAIWSNRRIKADQGEALRVVLKIWRQEQPVVEDSMTYLRTAEKVYADFSLDIFARPVKQESKTTVRLETLGGTPLGPSRVRRKSSLNPFKSKDRSNSHFKRDSIDSDITLTPMEQLFEGLKWLVIQFSSQGDAEDFTDLLNRTKTDIDNNTPNTASLSHSTSMQLTQPSHSRTRTSSLAAPEPTAILEDSDRRMKDSPSPRTRPTMSPRLPQLDFGAELREE